LLQPLRRALPGDSCALSFELPPDEGIYGLGPAPVGRVELSIERAQGAGVTVTLAQRNTDVAVPAIASSKGYMLLWGQSGRDQHFRRRPGRNARRRAGGRAGRGVPQPGAGPNVVRWSSEFGKAIDYYFCYRDGAIEAAMQAYRRLNWRSAPDAQVDAGLLAVQGTLRVSRGTDGRGHEVARDESACRWNYSGLAILAVRQRYLGIHKFDPGALPGPDGHVQRTTRDEFHNLISVWAKFDLGSDNSKELNAGRGMFPDITRYVSPPGQGQWYDPFAPSGR